MVGTLSALRALGDSGGSESRVYSAKRLNGRLSIGKNRDSRDMWRRSARILTLCETLSAPSTRGRAGLIGH